MAAGLPVLEQRLKAREREQAAVRLRRIEGQVRGLLSMIGQDRYCVDILTQIASVQEALRGVGKLIMRNYLESCAAEAIRKGGKSAEQVYGEILDLMYRYVR
ncbi:MAG: metal-sensitive transcriptional regulator [Gemmatimonadetes bacterium]|nr:metal-sensitive transcriptional regulator [Gemmatimonadota bacterium]